MALFKYPILPTYNILYYDNDYLILHCSRFDEVYAPFDGEIIQSGTNYILHNGNIDLYINHIKNVTLGKVKFGNKIGVPIVDNKFRNNIATIGIKIYNKNKIDDVLTYLKLQDKDVKQDKVDEVKEPKKRTTKKKK